MLSTQRLIKSAFILLFVASATFVTAQEEQTAELKVTINDIITFTLNDANPTLIFDESDDFINGVTYTASNAGVVTASGAFSLSVTAENKDLEDSAGNKIAAESVAVEATGSGIGTTTKISLKKGKQDIISGAPAAISKSFDLTYSTTGNDTEFIGKPAGDYTVDLTFTATLD
jgi:hypothetical protein